MERRRADGGLGLLARVRWGNVGRLAALLAAALLVLSGPRGCGRTGQGPAAVVPVRPAAPPTTPPAPKRRTTKPTRAKRHHKPKPRARRGQPAPQAAPATQE